MNIQNNPLLDEWKRPYGIPPFDKIEPLHFMPAIKYSISEAWSEIERITGNTEAPSFENSIEPLERCGKQLNRIAATLFNLNSAETNSEIQKVTQEVSPILTRFSNDITLNTPLFERIKSVYELMDSLNLNSEQKTLLTEKHKSFIKGGAELKAAERERFREVSEELSVLTVKFEENLLAETNGYELHITDKKEMEGLPPDLTEMAASEALSRKKSGWVFTHHAPSYIPFMQYAANRDLRREMLVAYSSRCFKGNKNDNREIVKKIVNLRLELANLLGYNSYADLILEDTMAGSATKVNRFLEELFGSSRPFAIKDYKKIQKYASMKGHNGDLERWDWAYYSEKYKKEFFSIDDEILKPYFKLENAERAIFALAGSLYGLQFEEITDCPVYHKDTRTFKINERDGNHLSVLILDYHPRKGKSGGAWMTAFREQHIDNNKDIRPIISIVMNFSRATNGKPALLTHRDLTTLLHEFGHALHGMMSKCTYESLSGTNVRRDFVELPSQIMENWAYEKEWLDTWAVHYETGEKIPAELINKVKASLIFNEGYACNRQLSFGILDMAWHSITEKTNSDPGDFENKAIEKSELFTHVEGTNQSCAFGHLFSGGYAAGYYGYKWAEVLDADAFSLFLENGIFDKKTAESFKTNILERGGSDNPMELYTSFRGKEPTSDALLARSGFIER